MFLTLTFQTRDNKQKFHLSKQAQGFSHGGILMAKKLCNQKHNHNSEQQILDE